MPIYRLKKNGRTIRSITIEDESTVREEFSEIPKEVFPLGLLEDEGVERLSGTMWIDHTSDPKAVWSIIRMNRR